VAKQPILAFLASGVRVLDGGMGSMMIEAGLPVGQCPETFDGDKIRRIHEQYVEAGADIILSCTFGASPITLAKHGIADRMAELNGRNARLALEAAGDRAYVLGDLGPTGELIAPMGALTEDEIVAAFASQARALDEAGVDGFIIETMMDPTELRAAARAVRQASAKPLFASMTFTSTPRGFRTMFGTTPEQAVQAMEAEGVDVIGTNCTLAPDEMPAVVAEIARHTTRPVFAEPNAGRPTTDGERVIYPMVENLEQHIEALIDAGARVIGGCCGTTPDYVRSVRRVVDRKAAAK
jgi:5-methyltetrahydrofolate--homocysteine methyltransferase